MIACVIVMCGGIVRLFRCGWNGWPHGWNVIVRRGWVIVRGIACGRAGYFAAFIAANVLHALP